MNLAFLILQADHNVSNPVTPQAGQIDAIWQMFFWTCAAVWILVTAFVFAALYRRRKGDGTTPDTTLKRSVTLATALTVVVLCVFFVASVIVGSPIREIGTQNPLSIKVVGNQWWWDAEYQFQKPSDNVTTANELHVPVGRDVIVSLASYDVIHSFWVPNLTGKMDAIPARINSIKFRVDRPGEYRGQCAEFCGLQHAHMALFVFADPPGQFENWLTEQRRSSVEPTPGSIQEKGRQVFLNAPCVLCHSIRGTQAAASVGPDLTHLASRRTIAAGTLLNNRGNLGGWITDAQRVKPGTKMPSINVAPQDLQPLLAYLESLQ